jgi:UDP-N-acetylmuramyl tripeptide synthase
MKFILTLWLAKLVALAVNLIDKQRGTNYSGKIALRLMPDFVARFKGIDYDKVIFVTGTNGKSTTNNLIGHTLRSAGKTVASNVEGANMMGGVATTLIKNSTLSGRLNKELLVLEIDERSLPAIRKVLPARHMCITNLQKDQVQRNGDPDFIYRKFCSAIGPRHDAVSQQRRAAQQGAGGFCGAKRVLWGCAGLRDTPPGGFLRRDAAVPQMRASHCLSQL